MAFPHRIVTRRHFTAASALLLAGLPPRVFAEGAQVEAPQYRVGDEWTLAVAGAGGSSESAREFGHKVVEVTADGVVLEGTNSNGRHFKHAADRALNAIRSDGENTKLLQFPLHVGASWAAEYHAQPNQRSRPRAYDLTREAAAMERLSVPAGEFECVRIDSNGLWSGDKGRNGNFEEHYWYAPKPRHIVKYFSRRWEKVGVGRSIEAEQSWELVRYSIT